MSDNRAILLSLVLTAWLAERAPAAGIDAVLAPGDRFHGRVAFQGDKDRVEVFLLQGTRLTLRVRSDQSTVHPRFLLTRDGVPVDLEGGKVFVDKKGERQTLKNLPIEESAVYGIEIEGKGTALGDYSLRVKEKLPHVLHTKVSATLTAAIEVPFPMRAGAAAEIVLTGAKGSGALPLPELLDPAGAQVTLDGLVVSEKKGRRLRVGPFAAAADGLFRLRVFGPSESPSKVKVRIEIDAPPPGGSEVFEPEGNASLTASLELVDGEWSDPSDWQSDDDDVAAGEVLVRLEPGAAVEDVAAELGLEVAGPPVRGWIRLRSKGVAAAAAIDRDAARARTRRLVLETRRRPGVAAAEPNHRRAAFAVPDDPSYPEQWDLPLCRFDEVWDEVPGDPTRAVAVLDTGIRFEHPDLAGRLLLGFDFVSEGWNAGDGDGPDPDPTDVFVSVGTHGTHVAGTIAAAFDDGLGIAGAAPQGRVLPVRVLGVLGGTDFDIAQGVLYAAGLANASGVLPPVPVDVINLSLGGPSDSTLLHDAIRAAVEAGVVVVAAGGNTGKATLMYPAAYPEVIAVAATNVLDERADYSTLGDHLLLAAPGGENGVDRDGDGVPDGILSTIVAPGVGPTWGRKAGTSMAAPHVSAAAFLLRSAAPQLTPALVAAVLAASAQDLGAPGRDDETGYGRLDVRLALDMATGKLTGPPEPFAVSPLRLSGSTGHLGVVNRGGGGPIQVTGVASDAPWIVPLVSSGATPLDIPLALHPEVLVPGVYESLLTVSTDQGDLVVPVRFEVDGDAGTEVDEVHVVAIDVVDGQPRAALTVDEAHAQGFDFSGVPEGTYWIVAVTDLDRDGVGGEDHDWIGVLVDPDTGAPREVTLPDGAALAEDTILLERGHGDALPKGKPIALPPP